MGQQSDFNTSMAIFDRQDTLAPRVARRLTYDAGRNLGAIALTDDGAWLRPLLIDACVLTARHGTCEKAARLLGVTAKGLRGLLHGAGLYLEQDDQERSGDAMRARAAEPVPTAGAATTAVH